MFSLGLLKASEAVPLIQRFRKKDGRRKECNARETADYALELIEKKVLKEAGSPTIEKRRKKDNELSQRLIEDCSSSIEKERYEAAKALGVLKERKAVSVLTEMLNDSSDTVREKAAWALGEIADPRAIPALADVVRRTFEFEDGRPTVEEALRKIGDRLSSNGSKKRGI